MNRASAFLGYWKIVEMEVWEPAYIDLVVSGLIEFEEENGTVRLHDRREGGASDHGERLQQSLAEGTRRRRLPWPHPARLPQNRGAQSCPGRCTRAGGHAAHRPQDSRRIRAVQHRERRGSPRRGETARYLRDQRGFLIA
jgi:hypothetical protein